MVVKAPRRTRTGGQGDGVPVDFTGGPATDPTENVLELVRAESKRQDDLRQANNLRLDGEIAHVKEVALLRSDCAKEIALLRASHGRDIAIAETGRVNAIRETDKQNVDARAVQSSMAVAALDATTKTLAENLQKQLATTADALAKQFQTTVAGFTADIGELKKALYTGVGKEAVADPQQALFTKTLTDLTLLMAKGGGKSEGMEKLWALLAGLAFLFFAWNSYASRQVTPVVTQPAPLIINVPSLPAGPVVPR